MASDLLPGGFRANLSVRRFSTIGGTSPATGAPSEATSLMSRDEMYV